jgi:hypothetical protein
MKIASGFWASASALCATSCETGGGAGAGCDAGATGAVDTSGTAGAATGGSVVGTWSLTGCSRTTSTSGTPWTTATPSTPARPDVCDVRPVLRPNTCCMSTPSTTVIEHGTPVDLDLLRVGNSPSCSATRLIIFAACPRRCRRSTLSSSVSSASTQSRWYWSNHLNSVGFNSSYDTPQFVGHRLSQGISMLLIAAALRAENWWIA